VEKNKIITGDNIEVGDVLVGLPSNGLHTCLPTACTPTATPWRANCFSMSPSTRRIHM